MRRSRFSDEQIIGILIDHQAGMSAADLCRKYGVSDATFYKRGSKYGGSEVSEAKRQAVEAIVPEDSVDTGIQHLDAVIALEVPDDADRSEMVLAKRISSLLRQGWVSLRFEAGLPLASRILSARQSKTFAGQQRANAQSRIPPSREPPLTTRSFSRDGLHFVGSDPFRILPRWVCFRWSEAALTALARRRRPDPQPY
jgi:hypothetical protein